MYDAYGKFPTDGMISSGNFWALGSPSSCLEVEVSSGDYGDFLGRYCGALILPPDAIDDFGDGVDARKVPPVMDPDMVNRNPVG